MLLKTPDCPGITCAIRDSHSPKPKQVRGAVRGLGACSNLLSGGVYPPAANPWLLPTVQIMSLRGLEGISRFPIHHQFAPALGPPNCADYLRGLFLLG